MRRPGSPRDVPPPLEMLCLKALWRLEAGNVKDVQRLVAETRPLAYTTVMTVLERLSRKAIVGRRKVSRSFEYYPEIGRDSMRRLALKEFVDCYFDGSEAELAQFLGAPAQRLRPSVYEERLDAALL
ncbi:MAG: BlaI/MecI/CopY family transcriptional regulator [Bryobacteraceae bacterium]